MDADLAVLAADPTDYKARIASAQNSAEKQALARQLAKRRLSCSVVPELDACFAALERRQASSIVNSPPS